MDAEADAGTRIHAAAALPDGRWRPFEIAFWLILVVAYFVLPGYRVLGSQILIAGLFAVSLDLILGYAGIVSLGHAAFFGIGAYTAGLLAAHGWGEPLTGLLAAAVYTLKPFRSNSASRPVPMRFVIPAPEKASQILTPAVSPDGRMMIFSALFDGTAQLWQRQMDSTAVQPVAGVSGLQGMHAWSPDSRSIAFAADGKLKRLDFAAGPPRVVCSLATGAQSGEGASGWNSEGVILFTSNTRIYRVSADGGEPEPLVGSDNGDPNVQYRWPYFLPDGRRFVYSRADKSSGTAEIYVGSLDSKETTRLTAADSQAIFFSNPDGGYLAFVRGNSLVAQPFDPAARSASSNANTKNWFGFGLPPTLLE